MPPFTTTLIDTDAGLYPSMPHSLDAESTAAPRSAGDWSIDLQRLFGGLSDGVDVVTLRSGSLAVRVLPTRGMGLWNADCDGLPVGWKSPVRRPVHPQFVQLNARNGLGWLDGFNELLCRCGLAFNGPPGVDDDMPSPIESQLTLHGRIANLPAHRVDAFVEEDGRIGLRGIVDECTMFGPQLRLESRVSLAPGGRTIEIADRVTNLASSPAELQLLYHINVGPPFLGDGSEVVLPAAQVAPRDPRAAEGIDNYATCSGPTPGYTEQAYFFQPLPDSGGRSLALLRSAANDCGFVVRAPVEQLPCLTVWKCTQAEQDGYVTGIEPGTNYPNFKSFERQQGRVRVLQPGETATFDVFLEILTTRDAVMAVESEAVELQSRQQAVIHRSPREGFSPTA